jgi:nitroreductase
MDLGIDKVISDGNGNTLIYTALIAAAYEEVDCTPMEGFDPVSLDEILNLKAKGLRSVVMLPLGYRNADEDWLLKLKKVRKPKESFITWIE